MSSEFEDIDASLQQGSQRTAPTAANGPKLGTAAPEAPQALTSPTLASGGGPAPAPEPENDQAALVAAFGIPDALPPTWCKKCQAEVKPEGKGRCPRCQTFLRLNFSRRKHPVNVLRRRHLLDKLVADYRPSTTLLHATCEHLAGILEQLETLKPGSPDHQRLVQLSQLLGAALEESRSARLALQPDLGALSDEQLIERTTAILRQLLATRDAQRQSQAHITAACGDAGPSVQASADPTGEAPVPTSAPAPEPVCVYCHRVCVGPEHHAFDVLHWDDPTEIAKREKEATAVMLTSMGRARRGEIPQW